MEKESQLSEAKRKLLEQMRRAGGRASSDQPVFKSHKRDTPIPLSPSQEQVWRLDQAVGKLSALHNESITIHRHGECDRAIVQRCLEEIVRRHEIWRTTYSEVAGNPIQVIHPSLDFKLEFSDLGSEPAGEARALELATEDAKRPFDLERGPLFRARLATLRDDQHRLYLTMHQSIVDGLTVFDIFPNEFTTLYENFSDGTGSGLPELPAQFADFACWQREKLSAGAKESQLAYWQKQLEGKVPALQWPNRGGRPERQTFRGAMYPFEFSGKLSAGLKELARREGVTLFMVLLAGFYVLLHRDTGQEDIIVGTLSPSGRKRSAFQKCMGYFLNPVPLRARISRETSLPSLLQQVRQVTLGAISNDDVTLEMIAERLQFASDLSRHLFFDVALSLAPEVAPLPPGWAMTYMDVESGGARWDLYIEFSDRSEALMGRAQYNPDVFTPQMMSKAIKDLRGVLEEIASSKTFQIS